MIRFAILASACLCAVLLHRYSQLCGIGLTYDSLNYLHASQTWLTQGILLNQDNTLFLQQPPLFPLILSLFSPYQQAIISWVHTLCLAIVVGIWGSLAMPYVKDIKWLLLYAWLLAWATPLLLVHHFLWSEPIYLLLSSVLLLAIYAHCEQQYTLGLAVLVFCLGLVPLQRLVGVALVLAVLIVLGADKNTPRMSKIALLSAGILPIGIWLSIVYSYRTPQEFMATYGVQTHFWEGVVMYLDSLSLWFFPKFMPLGLRIVGVSLMLFLWFKVPTNRFTQVVFVYFLSYTAILIAKKSDFWDTERFVALLYPLFLWLTFVGIVQLKTQRSWVFIVACCLSVYPTLRCAKNILFWREVQCKKATLRQTVERPVGFSIKELPFNLPRDAYLRK